MPRSLELFADNRTLCFTFKNEIGQCKIASKHVSASLE